MEFVRRLSDGFIQTITASFEDIQDIPEESNNIHDKRNRSGSVDSGFVDSSEIAAESDLDDELPEISLDELLLHSDSNDGWIAVYDKVYNVTSYIPKHPGSEEVLLEYLGYDATSAFRSVGHSKAALNILEKYCIGILPVNERIYCEK